MSIVIPAAETVKLYELKVDGENPNKMSKEQLERLKTSIKNWGFIVPICGGLNSQFPRPFRAIEQTNSSYQVSQKACRAYSSQFSRALVRVVFHIFCQ